MSIAPASLPTSATPGLPALGAPAPNAEAGGAASGSSAAANPFRSLLAGLEAQNQPMLVPPTPADIGETMAATPAEALPATTDAAAVFMGPAFNSRLALVQTDQLAQAAPTLPATGAQPPAPAANTEPMSLLNLLSSKAAVQEVKVETAPLPAAVAPVATAEVIADVVAATPVLASLIVADSTTEVAPETASDEEALVIAEDASAVEASLNLLPTLPAQALATPKTSATAEQPIATSDLASETASEAISQGSARISLFDKLSGADAKTTDTDPQNSPADLGAADASANAIPLPIAANESIKTATQPVQVQAASIAQSEATAASNPPPPADLPMVTMRPQTPAQLIDGVSVLVARAGKSAINEFVIRMDPPELGRIDVQLKMHEDGRVQAVIASDNVSTYDLLRREASTIERALADSGLRMGSDGLSFNLKQQNGDQQRGMPTESASHRSNNNHQEEPIPAAVLTPLRQRYENARVNISA